MALYRNFVIGNIPNQRSVSLSLLHTYNCHHIKQKKYVLRIVMGQRYSGVVLDQVGCNEDQPICRLFVVSLPNSRSVVIEIVQVE